MNVLGISAFYHDSAAALVIDGVPVCAVQEERRSMTGAEKALLHSSGDLAATAGLRQLVRPQNQFRAGVTRAS